MAPASLLYGSVQTGYNQGGFNSPSSRLPRVHFKPEHLLAFTVGSKNTFLNNRLVINDEVFYYDYDSLQVASFDATKGSGFRVNIPKSVIYGDQIDVAYKLSANTVLTAAWSGSAHISCAGRWVRQPSTGGRINIRLAARRSIPPCVPATRKIDYSGYSLGSAPPVSGDRQPAPILAFPGAAPTSKGLSARTSMHRPGGCTRIFRALTLAAVTTTDLTLTYHPAGGPWSIAAWAKNVENSAGVGAVATDSIYGQAPAAVQPPRTFGLRLGFKFD